MSGEQAPFNLIKNLLVFFLVLPLVALGQVFSIQENQEYPASLMESVEIFEDSTQQLSLAEVENKIFIKSESPNRVLLPYDSSFYWLKIKIKNSTADSNWVIHLGNPLIRKTTFYTKGDDEKELIHLGFARQAADGLTDPNFPFVLNPNKEKTYYVKIESERGIYFSLQIFSADTFKDFTYQRKFRGGFLVALNFLSVLMFFALGFFIVRDFLSKAYAVYIVSRSLFFWALYNILGPAISGNPEVAEKIALMVGNSNPIIAAAVSLVLLPIKKISKWSKWSMYGIIGVGLILEVGLYFKGDWFWLLQARYLVIVGHLVIYGWFAYTLISKKQKFLYYAIPFLIGNITCVVLSFRVLGVIEVSNMVFVALAVYIVEMAVYVLYLNRNFRMSVNYQAERLNKLTREAEQVEQLKQLHQLKTNFFTNVSHELRTPLTLISGPINDLVNLHPKEKLLELVQRNTNKLKQLVNQILDVQKIDSLDIEPLIEKGDVAQFIRMHSNSFSSLATSRDIKFTYKENVSSLVGYFDKERMEKVLNNLLINAFKFTKADGEVNVEVVLSELDVKIIIRDTGIGIPKEKLSYVFDRFFHDNTEAYENTEGSGVGLALVSQYVNFLKGEVNVFSEENKGTSFEIVIPIDFETWKGVIKEKNVSKSEVSSIVFTEEITIEKGEVLLIVEDNDDMRLYLKSIFQDSFRILEAKNGLEGLKLAEEEVPDIIISDLMMPEMNGFEFSEGIKSNDASSHVPIVMLTAKNTKETKLEGYGLGIEQFVSKPFDKDELKGILNSTLKNRKVLQKAFSNTVILNHKSPAAVEKVDSFLIKFRKYLEENYANSGLTLSQMAANFNFSEKQFSRKVKSLSNATPKEFLRKYRLKKAADMIKVGNKTVSEIAFEVGYENLSYFSKSFSEEFGVLPSKYANKGL